MGRTAALLGAVGLLGTAAALPAEDWSQWGGPRRNFTVPDEGLAPGWPEGGPPVLWESELGEGYSAIVVAEGTLYTMARRGDEEVVVALDASTGETRWERGWPAPFDERFSMENGPGPHATPLVTGGTVFAVGATGKLHALAAADGDVRWSRDLISELGGTPRRNGYSSSPLAFRDLVILPVGGEGQALAAFRQRDGEVVWRSGDFDNATSSPILIEVGDQRQLVSFLYSAVAGFDPATGALLWSHPHVTDFGLNTSTPVWSAEQGILFISSAYGSGSRGLRLTSTEAGTEVEELWATTRMRIHFGNAVRVGELIVGANGDFGPAPLTALELTTGRVRWRDRTLSRSSLVAVGERLILLDEDGRLALARATEAGITFDATAELLGSPAWTVPTLVGRTLYVRDRHRLLALDLG